MLAEIFSCDWTPWRGSRKKQARQRPVGSSHCPATPSTGSGRLIHRKAGKASRTMIVQTRRGIDRARQVLHGWPHRASSGRAFLGRTSLRGKNAGAVATSASTTSTAASASAPTSTRRRRRGRDGHPPGRRDIGIGV